jgi:hypothetical protein
MFTDRELRWVLGQDLWTLYSVPEWNERVTRGVWRNGMIPTFTSRVDRLYHEVAHMLVCEVDQLLSPGWGYPYFRDANPSRMSPESVTVEIKAVALERLMKGVPGNPVSHVQQAADAIQVSATVSPMPVQSHLLLCLMYADTDGLAQWLSQYTKERTLAQIQERHAHVRGWMLGVSG